MDCEKANELMSLYIDAELDIQEINELETHIKNCSSCQSELNHLLYIVDNLKSMPQLELPNNFHDELINNIKINFPDYIGDKKINKKYDSKKSILKNWKIMSGAAVAACFIIFISSMWNTDLSNEKFSLNGSNQMVKSGERTSFSQADMAQFTEGSAESEAGAIQEDVAVAESMLSKKTAPISDTNENNNISGAKENNTNVDKKIILNATISIEVYNFDNTIQSLKSIAEQAGGYIENSNSTINYNDVEKNIQLKSGEITLRVPSNSYETILNSASELGTVISSNEYIKDVQVDYVDTQSLLKAKKLEEERLLAIMEKTNTVQDLILLEQRLNAVRGELEVYTGRINNWDRLIEFSNITVNIMQIKEDSAIDVSPSNLSGRIKKGFINSINNIKATIENLVVLIAQAMPLIIIIVFIGVIIFIIRVVIKKFRAKKVHKD